MTKLEFFEAGLALSGVRLGIISSSVLMKYDIYKTYLEFLASSNDQEHARRETLKRYNCHYSTMARAIYYFERESWKDHITYKDLFPSLRNAANKQHS